MSCSKGGRRSLDLALLWLWYRLAASALIHPLAWELPYAVGAALKKKKKKKDKIKNKQKIKKRQCTKSELNKYAHLQLLYYKYTHK